MNQYYYGVQTALSYIFNHYCYNAVHYTYLSREYYSYRRKNPRSSNPHRVYEDIYEPWKDKDEYSKMINQLRMNMRNGVIAKRAAGVIDPRLAIRLEQVCDEIDVGAFYPIVYRVNIRKISRPRLIKAGSGMYGSLEYLVQDLQENEIYDILFLDYDRDRIINELVTTEFSHFRNTGSRLNDANAVIRLLEERVQRHVKRNTIQTTNPGAD